MATANLTIGPAHRGRRMTVSEFESSPWEEGYRYELIDGRLSVSPSPNPPHDDVWVWLFGLLHEYSQAHPKVLARLTPHARVFPRKRPGETNPEPDITGYQHYLKGTLRSWRQAEPVLVVEIVSPDDPDKDLFRNVDLYEQVPSIREYWILDPRDGLANTTLRVYRRRGRQWQKPLDVGSGETYSTKLLPGFCLRIDPLA